MILTLEVMGPEGAKLGAASRKVFNATGGTIGRQTDNSWVLVGPYVSARHAVIRYTNGAFYLEDTSRNGIFINSQENRLGPEPYALQSGDVIFIEPFAIHASIASPAQAPDPFAFADPFADQQQVSAPSRSSRHEIGEGIEVFPDRENVDPLKLLEPVSRNRPTPPDHPSAELSRDPVAEHYKPPPPVAPKPMPGAPPGGLIPESYDPLRPDSVVLPPPRPAPETPRPASARPASRGRRPAPASESPSSIGDLRESPEHGDLAAVLRAAGLSNVPVTPDLARDFGEILRIVVSGVMDVLEARQKIKDEFRIRVTTVQRADKVNNPLKLSADVDDALHNLLVKRNARYLGPVEAFDDAFRDIRNHQMAMLAGMRAAFHAMLAEFEPGKLQEAFDRQLKGGGPQLVPAKMRYWEMYQKKVHDMVRDAETTFRELFGDQFADAYEEQLKLLKAPSRSGKR